MAMPLTSRDEVLDPSHHQPSALAVLPKFQKLATTVADMERNLPPGIALLSSLRAVRDETWQKLKDIMSDALVEASGPLKWPLRVDYPSVPAEQRRTFERRYTELLYLQQE